MAHAADDLLATDIEALPATRHEHKSLLRFITCGSVDDGKSTLIGRLLYESKLVFEDHLAALEVGLEEGRHPGRRARLRAAGRRPGGRARAGHHHRRRLPVLLHRAAQVHRRRHPGPRAVHPQHGHRRLDGRPGRHPDRRAQGRADPDPAAQLPRVAARHQARRAGDQQARPRRLLAGGLRRRSRRTTARSPPRSGSTTSSASRCRRCGATTSPSRARTPRGTTGPTLIEYLETVEIDDAPQDGPFRMPVQWVNRPNLDFRGFSGEIVGGTVRVRRPRAGRSRPARESTVARIVTFDGDLDEAAAGQSITITLTDEVDVSRGDVLAAADAAAAVADQFEAHIIWMNDEPMLPGRPYLFKLGTRTVGGDPRAAEVQGRTSTRSSTRAAKTLELNEIGVCNLNLDPADRRSTPTPRTATWAASSSSTGITNATVGGGPAALRAAPRRQRALAGGRGRPGGPRGDEAAASRRWSGSPACPAPASRPSPTSSSASCTRRAGTRTCSTATTCATA